MYQRIHKYSVEAFMDYELVLLCMGIVLRDSNRLKADIRFLHGSAWLKTKSQKTLQRPVSSLPHRINQTKSHRSNNMEPHPTAWWVTCNSLREHEPVIHVWRGGALVGVQHSLKVWRIILNMSWRKYVFPLWIWMEVVCGCPSIWTDLNWWAEPTSAMSTKRTWWYEATPALPREKLRRTNADLDVVDNFVVFCVYFYF